jgi:hypothetical protein
VNWLVRQLKDAPDATRVEVFHRTRPRLTGSRAPLGGAGEPRQPGARPRQRAPNVPGREVIGPGCETWSRTRFVHRLGPYRCRRLLRRGARVAASVVLRAAEAASGSPAASRRHSPGGPRLDRLLLPGRNTG